MIMLTVGNLPTVNMIIDHVDVFSGDNPASTKDLSQDDQNI